MRISPDNVRRRPDTKLFSPEVLNRLERSVGRDPANVAREIDALLLRFDEENIPTEAVARVSLQRLRAQADFILSLSAQAAARAQEVLKPLSGTTDPALRPELARLAATGILASLSRHETAQAQELLATLEKLGSFDPLSSAYFLYGKGLLAYQSEHYEEAIEAFRDVRERAADSQENRLLAMAWRDEGIVWLDQGDFGEAREAFQLAYEKAQEEGDLHLSAVTLRNLGGVYFYLGDFSKALELCLQGLELQREIGDRHAIASSYSNIASIHFQKGELESALEWNERGLALHRQMGNLEGEALALYNCGKIHLEQNENARARDHFQRSLEIGQQLGKRRLIYYGNVGMTSTLLKEDQHHPALQHLLEALEKPVPREEASLFKMLAEIVERGGKDLLPLLPEKVFTWLGADETAHRDPAAVIALALMRGHTMAEEQKNRRTQLACAEHLARFLASRDRHTEAFTWLDRAYRLTQELNQAESDQLLRNLQVLHQVTEAQHVADVQKENNRKLKAEIEQRRAAEAKLGETNHHLRKLNDEKTEIMSIAAHDLKNPLTGIRLMSEFLAENNDLGKDEQAKRVISDIQISATQMHDIIVNLLNAKRIEDEGFTVTLGRCNVATVFSNSLNMHYLSAQRKYLTMEFSSEEDSAINEAVADHGLLRHVADNLISNAIKFSPQNTTVRTHVWRNGSIIGISVSDEGPGIKPDEMPRLFQKYTRLSAQPTGGESSTGLGLSIAKRLTEAMHGSISCKSTPGEGARFCVELPAYDRPRTTLSTLSNT